jgi:hypothetical protein
MTCSLLSAPTQNSSRFVRCAIFSIFSIILFPISSTRSFSCSQQIRQYQHPYNRRIVMSGGEHTHVLLQPFKLGQSIVAQVELLQRNQPFKILHLGDTIRLDRKDLEVAESAQVLVESRRHSQIRTSQLPSCFQVRTDMELTSKALILFFPNHSSSSRVNFSRFSIFWQSFRSRYQSSDQLTLAISIHSLAVCSHPAQGSSSTQPPSQARLPLPLRSCSARDRACQLVSC